MNFAAFVILLAAPAAALSLTRTVPHAPTLALRGRPAFMAEEGVESAAPAAQPVGVAAKPAAVEEKKREFDITQYSITLSIFSLFVIVKTLAYFGIMDTN